MLGGEQGGVSGSLSSGAQGSLGLGAQMGGAGGVHGGIEGFAGAQAQAGAEAGASASGLANAAADASAKIGGGILSFFGGPSASAGAHADARLAAAAHAGVGASAELAANIKAGIGASVSAFLNTAAQAAVSTFAQGQVAGQFAQFFNTAAGMMAGSRTTNTSRDVSSTVREQVHEAWSQQSNTVIVSNRWWLSMQVWQLDLFVRFDDGSEMVMPTTHYTTNLGRSAPNVRDSMLEQFGIMPPSKLQRLASFCQGLC